MFLCRPFCCVLFIQLHVAPAVFGEQTFMASFQTDIRDNTLASTDVWVEFSGEIPRSKEFTVCHWIKIKFHNSENAGCLWSYCTEEKPGDKMECLQVCMASDHLTLNRNLMFVREVNLKTGHTVDVGRIEVKNYRHRTWTHLCWSYSAQTGESRYYHDGKILDTEQLDVTDDDLALKASSEMSKHALIFGQEQDEIGGGFQKGEAYIGHLSEFNIWNFTLSDKQVLDMASCTAILKGNVLAWEKSGLLTHNVNMKDIKDIALFCNNSTEYVIFTKKMKFSEGETLCKINGGNLVVPKSDQESQKILAIVSKHKKMCTGNSDSKNENAVWIGAIKIDHKWHYLLDNPSHGTPLKYTKILRTRTTPYSNCAYLRNDGFWLEGRSDCGKISLCTVCEITGTPVFTIKGLCTHSDYDWNYYLSVDKDNQIMAYEGYKRSRILFDHTINDWISAPYSDYSKDTVGKLKASDNYLLNHPIGRQNWSIYDPYCKLYGHQHTFTMSKCEYPQQFTCNSGHCIDIVNRCGGEKQCQDGSDEEICDWVKIPAAYNVANPPASRDGGNPLEIGTKVTIEHIDSIDTVNMILSLTMKITFQWNDKVLMFSNLIPDSNNLIPTEKRKLIWNPFREMIQDDAIIGGDKYDKYYLSVHGTIAQKSDFTNPIENRLYNGSNNPLMLTLRMKTKYICAFDVRRFPFDGQQCELNMKINQRQYYKISFTEHANITYGGETIIDQFSIGKIYSNVTYSNESTQFTVIIPMSRIAINHFLNTFFPTVILWSFGYSTLFIEPNDNGFDNRFMGSGTALLVIATLINAVKTDLPQTAYTKFIDIWFLWHVLAVFVIIVYHIVLDRIRKNLEKQTSKKDEIVEFDEDEKTSLDAFDAKTIKNINITLIIVFPTVNGLFYIVYFYLKLM